VQRVLWRLSFTASCANPRTHGTFCLQVADAAKKCADDFAASAAGPTIQRHAATRPKWQGLIDRFSKDCGFDEVAGISSPIEKVRPWVKGEGGGGKPRTKGPALVCS